MVSDSWLLVCMVESIDGGVFMPGSIYTVQPDKTPSLWG